MTNKGMLDSLVTSAKQNGFKVSFFSKTMSDNNSVAFIFDNRIEICEEYDDETKAKALLQLLTMKELGGIKNGYANIVASPNQKTFSNQVADFIFRVASGLQLPA